MQLSIIIPVLNEEATIASVLDRLQGLRQEGCAEIILVDGGSSDATVSIAGSMVDHLLQSEPGRALQMNRGAEVAQGQWLMFLHADTQLPDDFVELIFSQCRSSSCWGRFDVRLSGGHWLFRVIERMINLRSRISGIATGDQAVFVRAETFRCVGGYAAMPLMEDVDLSRRLKRIGFPVCIRAPAITSSRRWEQRGILATVWLMWKLRLLYFLGVSPERLVEQYYPPHLNRSETA